jgi:hypothetical protein
MESSQWTPALLIKTIDEQRKRVNNFMSMSTQVGIGNALKGKYTVSILLRNGRIIEIVRPMWQEQDFELTLNNLTLRVSMAYENIVALTSTFPIRLEYVGGQTDYILTNLETSFSSNPILYELHYGPVKGNLVADYRVSPDILNTVTTSKEVRQLSSLFHFPLSAN